MIFIQMKNYKLLLAMSFIFALSCSSKPVKEASAPLHASDTPDLVFSPQATSVIPKRREFPVNESIRPCDNFYEYTCSKVKESFRLREDRSSHTFSFNDSYERLLEAKKTFFEKLSHGKAKTSRSQMLQSTFLACMNEEARKAEEQSLVAQMLKNVQEIKSREDFLNKISSNIYSKELSLIDFFIISNHDQPDQYDIVFYLNLLTLPEKTYYDNPQIEADLTDLVKTLFQLTGDPQRAEERAQEVIKFEKKMSRPYPLPAEFRVLYSTKTGISRADLLTKHPNFGLKPFLNQIPDSVHIRDITPKYFEEFNQALGSEDLNLLKDFYFYKMVWDLLDDAYPEFYKKRFDFNHKHFGGPAVRPDRQERCTKFVMGQFDRELDSELLPELFPSFPTKKFKKLAEKIRLAIVDGLKKNSWLSEEGRKGAIAKMAQARLHLVKPEREQDWDFNLPAQYSKTTHYNNIRLLKFNRQKKYLTKLKKKRNRNEWSMGPLTVNAYYSPSDNKFVMPIGILQYPFYDPALSDEVNLAAVGSVIGHELGHGIDDKGSKYDAEGRLKQWMLDSDLAALKERGQKFITQFNQIGHNGELTLGENIGDFVGLTFAFDAAFKSRTPTLEESRAFFIQYGRLWCNVARPKFKEMLLKTDPHSLGEARVNQQVKNQAAFFEAFSCKKGDPMFLSESDRVRVW